MRALSAAIIQKTFDSHYCQKYYYTNALSTSKFLLDNDFTEWSFSDFQNWWDNDNRLEFFLGGKKSRTKK